MKNNCCLFEMLSQILKNDVLFLRISFFVLEIFAFVLYN